MSGRRTVLRVEDLHALIDGQLAPERRAIVESDLKADPDAQRLVSQLIADRDALRTALAPIQDEPIPQRLRVANVERDRRRHNRWLAVQAVAAALLHRQEAALAGWRTRLLVATRSSSTSMAGGDLSPRMPFVPTTRSAWRPAIPSKFLVTQTTS